MPNHQKYTLRIPFQVQPGYALGSTGASSSTTYAGMTVSLNQTQAGYALLVAGFSSSEAAARFTPRVWTGLTKLMLDRGSAFSGSMDPQPVTYPQPTGKPAGGLGKEFEGLADGDAPTIYPSGKNVGFLTMGQPSVTITIPAKQALESIVTGFQTEASEPLFVDERFRTAVALYSAALFEESSPARLLTLSMAFEVLAPVTQKHEVVQTLIDSWKSSVETARHVNASNDAAVSALESLEKELLFRRESSIRGRIREFVFKELGEDSGARDKARQVVSAYDARSTLLHDGRLQDTVLGKAIEDFRGPLKEILSRRIGAPAA